jgi:hypothetical protein
MKGMVLGHLNLPGICLVRAVAFVNRIDKMKTMSDWSGRAAAPARAITQ